MFIVISGILFFILVLILLYNTLRLPAYNGKKREKDLFKINIDDASKRLSDVIRFPTISEQSEEYFKPEPFQDLHNYLEIAFPRIHQTLTKETVNQHSLLYTWEGTQAELKPIMLTSHIDVVPVEEKTENKWTHPPFDGVISDGYIWGRGAMDVKGGVMAILEAVEHLIESGFTPKRTLILAFGHDEEVDGKNGAQVIGSLLKSRGVELEFLLDEGTPIVHRVLPGLSVPIALVAIAEKGFLTVDLSVTGEGGHSSVPIGLTSIAHLSKAIHDIETNPIKADMDAIVKKTMQIIAPQMPFFQRLILSNLWLFKGIVKRELSKMPATKAALGTTTATTIFNSGIKENVLPTKANALVNFRIHPDDTVESVLKHVQNVVKNSSIRIKEKFGSIDPSPVSDIRHPAYNYLESQINSVFPEVVTAPTLMLGATDARHYTSLSDNIFRFIPLRAEESDLERVHGTNERLSIDNYKEMIFFYFQLIKNASPTNNISSS